MYVSKQSFNHLSSIQICILLFIAEKHVSTIVVYVSTIIVVTGKIKANFKYII